MGKVGSSASWALPEGQPAIFDARVVQAGEILAVPLDHLSDVALHDSVLGETIPRAFLIRRSRLIERGAGMRIVGSCYVPDTRRLLEFCGSKPLAPQMDRS
jgi:thioredoxin reductase (NADPH)